MDAWLEQRMARLVERLMLAGDLPEDAAREACDEFGVEGLVRADFVDRYSYHSVRADIRAEREASRVVTPAGGIA